MKTLTRIRTMAFLLRVIAICAIFSGVSFYELGFRHNDAPVFVVVMNVTARNGSVSTGHANARHKESGDVRNCRSWQVHEGGHGRGFTTLPDGGK